jgi:hypothetical protein
MQDATGLSQGTPTYPVRLTVEYPERLSRLSTGFRLILVLPIVLFLYFLNNSIVLAVWATILVRGRIPRWLFDFQVSYHRFANRAFAYFALLTDRYPAFEGNWTLQYDVDYPEKPSRRKVILWKLITALPHIVILSFLFIAVGLVVFISWWAILFSGKFPRGLHRFVVGVLRWAARVTAYVESLTDVFPPYSLNEEAAIGGEGMSAAVGAALLALVIGGGTAGGVALYVYEHHASSVHVSLAQALSGDLTSGEGVVEMDNVEFSLEGGDQSFSSDLISARSGYVLVEFDVEYLNLSRLRSRGMSDIELGTIRLETTDGVHDARLLTADGVPAPINVQHGAQVELRAYFEIKADEELVALRAYPSITRGRHVAWVFDQ